MAIGTSFESCLTQLCSQLQNLPSIKKNKSVIQQNITLVHPWINDCVRSPFQLAHFDFCETSPIVSNWVQIFGYFLT